MIFRNYVKQWCATWSYPFVPLGRDHFILNIRNLRKLPRGFAFNHHSCILWVCDAHCACRDGFSDLLKPVNLDEHMGVWCCYLQWLKVASKASEICDLKSCHNWLRTGQAKVFMKNKTSNFTKLYKVFLRAKQIPMSL